MYGHMLWRIIENCYCFLENYCELLLFWNCLVIGRTVAVPYTRKFYFLCCQVCWKFWRVSFSSYFVVLFWSWSLLGCAPCSPQSILWGTPTSFSPKTWIRMSRSMFLFSQYSSTQIVFSRNNVTFPRNYTLTFTEGFGEGCYFGGRVLERQQDSDLLSGDLL